MSFEKINVTSVREQFVRDIENMILSGELKIGEKLPPARELCKLMGVSLTTVSTGITELANRGFIEVKPRHGAYVADYIRNGTAETFFSVLRYNGGRLNPHEIRSFTESRIAVDPFVIRLVIERASDEQISALGRVVGLLNDCGDAEKACALVTEFYQELYLLSDNSIFSLMYKTTVEVQKGMYMLYFEKNGLSRTKATISGIFEALKSRDRAGAQALSLSAMDSVIHGDCAIIPQK